MDPRLQKLSEVFKIIQDSVSKEELVAAMDALRRRMDAIGANNDADFKVMETKLADISKQMTDDHSGDVAEIKAQCTAMMKDMAAKIEQKVLEVDAKMDAVEDGKDADPVDPATIVPLVLAAMPKDPEETGDELILKINGAKNLISKDAIEGFAELEKTVAEKTGNTTRIGWGAHPVTVYHNSTVIDKNTRIINFASGLTVSRNASGVVTVSSTGGITELVATGLINSSNTVFTFVSKPTYIYIDGAKYKENAGWTWDSGTLTATTVKAPDFSIWGE